MVLVAIYGAGENGPLPLGREERDPGHMSYVEAQEGPLAGLFRVTQLDGKTYLTDAAGKADLVAAAAAMH